jgi:hypothetical protein
MPVYPAAIGFHSHVLLIGPHYIADARGLRVASYEANACCNLSASNRPKRRVNTAAIA